MNKRKKTIGRKDENKLIKFKLNEFNFKKCKIIRMNS